MGSIVGEVKEIITTSYAIWKVFETAKGRIHDAFDVIQRSQSRFEIYQPLVEKNLDKKKTPLNYDRFTTMMHNFKTNVEALIKLLEKYGAGKPGDKAWFMVAHLSDLDDLVKMLNKYLDEIVTFVDDMKKSKDNDASIQQTENDAKLKKQLATKESKKRHEEEKKRKKEQDLVMKLLLVTDRAELVKAAKDKDPKAWENIERNMVDMDEQITRADARRILGPVREEIKKTMKNDVTKTKEPQLGHSTEVKKPSISVEQDEGKLKPPPPNPSNSGPSSPGSDVKKDGKHSPTPEKKLPKMKHAFRIVCIDFYDGARATMAQCYLEHMRLLTVNTTGHWLFNRIESAGLGIEAEFLTDAVAKKVVDVKKGEKLDGQPLHPETLSVFNTSFGEGHSRETRELVQRMKLMKRRAITAKTFLGARHILCFGEYTHKTLVKLQAHAANQVKDAQSLEVTNAIGQITRLSGDFLTPDASTAELEKMLAHVKEQVNLFLAREFNWTRPTVKIWKGLYRSRQFCIPRSKRGEVEAKREEMCKKNDCAFIKVFYAAPELGVLVTVVGSMNAEKLLKAEEEIKALL